MYLHLHESDTDGCDGMGEDVGNAVGHSAFGVSLPGGPPLATLQGVLVDDAAAVFAAVAAIGKSAPCDSTEPYWSDLEKEIN